MSDLDNLLGGDSTPPAQQANPPQSDFHKLLGVTGAIVSEAGRMATMIPKKVGEGVATIIPYVGDLLGAGVVASLHGLEHPIANIGSQQEAIDNANVKKALFGQGPVTSKVSSVYEKAMDVPQPQNKFEEAVGNVAQMAGGAFQPESDIMKLMKGLGAGAGAGVVATGVNQVAPNSPGLQLGSALLAGAVTHRALAGKPDLIAMGQQHPEYSALTDIMFSNEGGGTIEHPKVSPKGAEGPAQVMPGTKTSPGYGVRPSDGTEADTVREGKDYLAALLGKYNDPATALAAYNDGPGNVDKLISKYGDDWSKHLPDETLSYVSRGMIKLGGVSGQEKLGSVRPMDPEAIANTMGNPEGAGVLPEDTVAEPDGAISGYDVHPEVAQQTNDFLAAKAMEGDKPPENVVDMTQRRAAQMGDENDQVIADNLDMANRIHKGIDQGVITDRHLPNIEAAKERLNDILDEHADDLNQSQVVAIKNNIELLNQAMDRLSSPTADRPIVDNTGYEKFTPNPEQNTPANENVAEEGQKAYKNFTEVKSDPDGTKYLEYKASNGDTIPIKLGIDDGTGEIAIDQFSTKANRLGPGEIRNAMYDLMQMYPEIKRFGGYRRSGASAGRVQEIEPSPRSGGGGGQEPPSGGGVPPSDGEPPSGNGGSGGDKFAGSINLDRMAISDKAKNAIRNMAPPPGADIESFNETKDKTAEYIDKHGIEGVLNRESMPRNEVNYHDQAVRAINAAAAEHFSQLNDEYTKMRFEGGHDPVIQNRYEHAIELFAKSTAQNSQNALLTGRGLGARRIVMGGNFRDVGEKLQSLLDSKANTDTINDLVNKNPELADKIVRDSMRPNAGDVMRSTWYAFLLSALKTPVRFATSSLMMMQLENISSAIGAVVGKFHGGEKMTFREAWARQLGMFHGAQLAFKTFSVDEAGVNPLFQRLSPESLSNTAREKGSFNPVAEAYRQGAPLDLVDRTQSRYIFPNKGLGRIVGEPLRNVGAHDESMRLVATMSDWMGMAHRTAAAEGLTGEHYADRVQDLMKNPTNEMWKSMEQYGQYSRLQDAMQWKGLQNWTRPSPTDPAIVKVMKGLGTLLIPFPRLADRKFFAAMRYSPLSVMEPKNLADLKAGGARADLAIGRIVTSWAATGALYAWAANGGITGGGPSEPAKRAEWLVNHQPYSLNFPGGVHVSMENVLHPLAPLAASIADLVDKLPSESGKPLEERMAQHVLGMMKIIGDASYTRGISEFFNAMDDKSGKLMEAWSGKMASSMLIPAAVSEVNKDYLDPVMRDTRASPFIDNIQANYPGASQKLPARHDVFGNVLTRDNPGDLNVINPAIVTHNRGPLETELDKLDAVYKKPLVTPAPKTVAGNKLTPAGQQKYQAVSGKLFKEYMSNSMGGWDDMSNEDKVALVKSNLRQARKDARAQLWGLAK